MSFVNSATNDASLILNGIIKIITNIIGMYCMYKIIDEVSLRSAIDKYIKFYAEERLQERFHCKTPLEVRSEALSAETPTQYPITENKRIKAYKAKWCA